MAYVSVPKDLTEVKNRVVFNLTKRQIVCLGIAAVLGLPFYFLTKDYIGSGNAATGMVMLMLPAFLFAMYEKDGLPLERVLMNVISVKFLRPAVRMKAAGKAEEKEPARREKSPHDGREKEFVKEQKSTGTKTRMTGGRKGET